MFVFIVSGEDQVQVSLQVEEGEVLPTISGEY